MELAIAKRRHRWWIAIKARRSEYKYCKAADQPEECSIGFKSRETQLEMGKENRADVSIDIIDMYT